jgi:NAD(P) transhydrogenase subunit alpha
MRIFVPKETFHGETRVPVLPATVAKLTKLGGAVEIESRLGETIGLPDSEYQEVGATVAEDRRGSFEAAELVLRLRKPPEEELSFFRRGSVHAGFLDPFNNLGLVRKLADAGVSAISMEMLPRTTLAQKMDVLSSQANLAGYSAVLLAADRSGHVLPLMMTPAGTIRPAKVFIIGVGVAGLQAIATAKRLGASVSAFDTRPEVEEQVRSLGAKFIKVDLGETSGTAQGYARALTPEQLAKQREAMAIECAQSDIVITTAQVFGRKAPVILTRAMVEAMKPGSVVVDLAVETGGNVEGSVLDQEVDVKGVKLLGPGNLPGRVARTASQMYSNNIGALVEHFWDAKEKKLCLDPTDALLQGCLITHQGEICQPTIRERAAAASSTSTP